MAHFKQRVCHNLPAEYVNLAGHHKMEKICIYEPYLKNYKKSALDAIESEWISNHGKYIKWN